MSNILKKRNSEDLSNVINAISRFKEFDRLNSVLLPQGKNTLISISEYKKKKGIEQYRDFTCNAEADT